MLTDWKAVDAGLRRLARLRAGHDHEEGLFLLAARRTAVHRHLGFGSLAEYVARVLGYDARTTNERLRVAEALQRLPVLAAALRDGAITWSAIRELTRVAVPETEAAWLSAATGRTAQEVQGLVSGQRPGARPGDPADPSLERRVIRLEVSPEALALFREAVGRLRRDVDPHLGDEEALMEMSRRVLGGPGDEGRSPYQVALTVCDRCRRTWQQSRGEAIEVGEEVAERAACDAQGIGWVDGGAGVAGGEAHVGSGAGAGSGAEVDRDPHVGIDAAAGTAHVGSPDSPSVPPAGLGVEDPAVGAETPAGSAHVGSPDSPSGPPALGVEDPAVGAETPAGLGPRGLARASQSIPPAVRRAVLRRDGSRCRVPGCRNTYWIDLHHTTTRAEGGTHAVDALLAVCGAHHGLVHGGFLIIEGRAPNFVFRHADGTPYGGAVSPAAAEAGAEAFSALRNLGLKDGEAKRALALARERVGAGAGTEALIRAALRARREALLPPRVDEKREPSPGPRSYPLDDTSGMGELREPSPAYGPWAEAPHAPARSRWRCRRVVGVVDRPPLHNVPARSRSLRNAPSPTSAPGRGSRDASLRMHAHAAVALPPVRALPSRP